MTATPDALSPDYSYLDALNQQQRDAVEYLDGPELVIAGAGSGKTRVLTYKIVHLLRLGYEPYRILALTFTNKAAREMKERVAGVVGEKAASRLWMGTFHSVFLRILRRHADLLGYKSNFTIYDAADSRSLVKSIIKDMGLDDKAYKPATVVATISNAKNALISPQQYAANSEFADTDRRAKRPLMAEIYLKYCARCRAAGAMDFDDILFNMNVLLRDHPDVCRHYQEFFRYILVDEYQDTNFAQHLIISSLAGEQARLAVVGDDAQSIYSFRGANIGNILNLERRYPSLRVFKLERNYRSTQNIVDASASLIAKNKDQVPKNVYSENAVGDRIDVVRTYSDLEEGTIVASRIAASRMQTGDDLSAYAVLYRTNAQSRVLEEALRKRNIPYRIYGGLSFYQRKEVKDAISYFRTAVNPDDDEALSRIINYPARGIGETTLRRLRAAAIEGGVSIWEVISHPEAHPFQSNSGTMRKLAAFKELISTFVDAAATRDAYSVGELIYQRTGILSSLRSDTTPESISKQENLQEILVGLKTFTDMAVEEGVDDMSMSAFLSTVALATDQDTDTTPDEPRVTLMTAHAAKGLEFPHVFIVGVEEELFPAAMSSDTREGIEEERRLLYVAMTRAEKTCTMTFATSRFRNGQTVPTRPSRFLTDIDRSFLNVQSSELFPSAGAQQFINPVSNWAERERAARRTAWGDSRRSAPRPTSSDATRSRSASKRADQPSVAGKIPLAEALTSAPPSTKPVPQPGTRIRHAMFGAGTVRKLDDNMQGEVIVVDFDNFGTKRLLVRFAKFETI